jgi:hypothetical protein
LPAKSVKKPALPDPKQYGKFIKGLDLVSLYVSKGSFSLVREEMASGSIVNIKDKAVYEDMKDNQKRIIHSYLMTVKNSSTKKQSISIEFDICMIIASKEEWTVELFEAYKKYNIRLNTWPFFRDFVFSSTSRMNIPPIALPFVKKLI